MWKTAYNVIANDDPQAVDSLEEDNKSHADHPGEEEPTILFLDSLHEDARGGNED